MSAVSNEKRIRDGVFLTKGIEEAFDHKQACFLYDMLKKQLVLWVADTSLMSKPIAGSDKPKTFSDVHGQPLRCPPDCLPYRRLLSWHAKLTLQLRPDTVLLPNFKSEYDMSPGRNNNSMHPLALAIDEMVQPGADASEQGESSGEMEHDLE
jgi:hypothetical protein